MLGSVLGWWAHSALAEAGGPFVPAALPIPAMAARADSFAPVGFVLEREISGDLGGKFPGLAQIYHNTEGRRALLIGTRHPDGFHATGWGFVLPCRACGADLSAADNVDVKIRDHGIVVIDRSESEEEDLSTRAELTLRYDDHAKQWRLISVSQFAQFRRTGRAEQSFVDYAKGLTRDAVGRYEGNVFFAESVHASAIEPRLLSLDELLLY